MSEKEASQVLTSENSGEFYAQKLGLAEAPEVVEPTEPPSEPKAEEEPKPTEEPKPNKLEKRFSKITQDRDMARQEAERERQRASDLETRLKELEAKSAPKPDPSAEPTPDQFQDAFEYAKALAKYETERALKERDRQEAERKVADERAKVFEAWNKKQEEAKSELPDYEDMIASSEVVVSDQVRDAIFESDVGPKILYHLAENPEIADRISKMSTINALREIGKLEARLEKAPQEEVKAVVKSNAPRPITPIKASSAPTEVPITSNGEFEGSYAQWKELRRAKKIR